MLIGVGLAISHFVRRFSDLVINAAVVQLLGLACGVDSIDATVFYSVLGAILALQISLSSIVSTTGSGVVDGAARFQEFRRFA